MSLLFLTFSSFHDAFEGMHKKRAVVVVRKKSTRIFFYAIFWFLDKSQKWSPLADHLLNLPHCIVHKMPFLSTFRVTNVHLEVVGGQKKGKIVST